MRGAILALSLAAVVSAAQAASVEDRSFLDADGKRVLRESVIVEATPGQVWWAFTTDEGFAKWGAPVVHIVPGNGGSMEFAPMPNGKIGDPHNVRHRIDVYQPDELLVFHNEFVPAGGPIDAGLFPTVRTVLTFEAVSPSTTRVTETVVGFGTGTAYDGLYEHLRAGNAEYLVMLAAAMGNAHFQQVR